MTKLTPFAIAAAILLPVGLHAQTMGDMDANADGVLTLDEVQAASAEIDADTFTAMDLNGDGVLDEDEVAAAQEAGMMPAADG